MNRADANVIIDNLRRAGNPTAADAKARELDRPHRLALTSTEPVAVTIPHLRVENPLNVRRHWTGREPLRRHQRAQIAMFLGRLSHLPRLPASVRLVRVYGGRGKAMDSDGLHAAFKAVRDAVAELYGVSDAPGSPLAFSVAQERGEAAIRVEIWPASRERTNDQSNSHGPGI